MAKKNARKGSTKSAVKNTTGKTTVNNMTEKKEATEVKAAAAKEAVAEKVTEVKEAVAEKATEVKEAVAEKAEKVKETAAKKATAKTTVKKTEEAPKRGRKPAAEKAATTKTATTKTASKKSEKFVPEIFVQFEGMEAAQADVIEKVKAQFVSEGHRAGNIKSLKIYIKPEDKSAYYVINDKNAGRVDLF